MKKGNVWALLPMGVFIALYLGLGITFEYVLKIPMGFYKVPVVVIFLVALLAACLQNRKTSFGNSPAFLPYSLPPPVILALQSLAFSGPLLPHIHAPLSEVAAQKGWRKAPLGTEGEFCFPPTVLRPLCIHLRSQDLLSLLARLPQVGGRVSV